MEFHLQFIHFVLFNLIVQLHLSKCYLQSFYHKSDLHLFEHHLVFLLNLPNLIFLLIQYLRFVVLCFIQHQFSIQHYFHFKFILERLHYSNFNLLQIHHLIFNFLHLHLLDFIILRF